MSRNVRFVFGLALLACALGVAAYQLPVLRLGKQPDGGFLVSTGQRIEPGAIAFDGRPIDIALHPSGEFFAVLNQRSVFLANRDGVIEGANAPLAAGAGYRGAAWTPDGKRLFVSMSDGYIQELTLDGKTLTVGQKIEVKPEEAKGNPRPGGMAITRDGKRLFVAAADRNAIAEIDLETGKWVREWPVQNLPFEVRLSEDEKTLIVSNWGGRQPEEDDEKAESGGALIVVDPRGAAASGTVSLIDRDTGQTKHIPVGLHPTGIAVQSDLAYIANAASDSISILDIPRAKVVRTIPIRWGRLNIFGSMPGALAINGSTLYVCDGGDNAVCVVDIKSGKVQGFLPAGYYPTGIALSADGKTAYVVNTKGNGSVRRTVKGEVGNAHDFQGTVSVVDLTTDLKSATERVALDNGWYRKNERPKLAVYNGAIQHVLYIIKENRTYDEVFGDLPQGNGDPKLCGLGEKITPNQHALAEEFTLFDNAYVAGTNSAEGHAWCNQGLANDYLERFYGGYRTYPYDGDCAMAISRGGNLWDAAAKKGKSLRVYGEFCDDELAKFDPMPKDWMEVWQDRLNKTRRFQIQAGTPVASLKKYIHPRCLCWPLLQSDQERADLFIEEYEKFSREDRVPNLMILSLPSDHTAGLDPKYPTPRSMVADNDLALGRIVEAVSHSPQWRETCIFVIEDDAQAGPDHIDGHRTVAFALSPYTRRKFVDSSLLNTLSIVRSIELMLGLDPMTKFDALALPFTACFTDTLDLTPYTARANRVPLGEMNPPKEALRGRARYWCEQSLKLDWSGLDQPDPKILNRVIWYSLHGDRPYPGL
jgi:DNA-binding beta-propeller fold protein YncE